MDTIVFVKKIYVKKTHTHISNNKLKVNKEARYRKLKRILVHYHRMSSIFLLYNVPFGFNFVQFR